MMICSSIAEVSPPRKILRAKNVFITVELRYKSAEMADKIRRRISLHPNWTLTFITLAALAPFLAKPFNIDDPLFIWAAHQIQAHPLNPFGFNVNWFGTVTPMWLATENPPVASYYMAFAAAILGWSEVALHFAFMLPAIAVVLGTHRLAQKFCGQPMLAALATLFTPVFLISSMTVMCDVMMLAFWIWAVVFWIEGTGKNDLRKLSAVGLLIALAALTKYYGVCLVPLLAAYSLVETRRPGRWAACLLIPLAALCAYQWITRALYGRAMLSDAMEYAGYARGITRVSGMATVLTALTFTGGCVAVAVFFMPLLWRARTLAAFAATAMLIAAALFFEGAKLEQFISPDATTATFVEIQIIFWAVGGIGVLALAVENLWNRRDAGAWLLALWVFGTFLFASVFNWTVNGRSILPIVPAVTILIVSRLERNAATGWKSPKFAVPVSLAVSAALALLVARADYLFAVAARQTAAQTFARFGDERKNLWFEGHWGFQYYMESFGFAALDVKQSPIKPGDILALPENNTGIAPPNAEATARQDSIEVSGPRFLTTMNVAVAAGFYASVRGPLPFAFGKVPPEKVFLFFLKTNAPASPENFRVNPPAAPVAPP
jgi:4-amino-4-deoxy-L-arabinose transferase-like glycosyltransferase